ncbi:hypothetical protein Mevan_0118 [Methanococcus vannielii SB]|uniref:Uncharacterized protein n=1 Tax=Methanococcus vannielii (strain ATCC 35089 / DSM 1224 / JCM 13029 / OCM 148 / SB) TaxID=406327 RepID=A6UNF8_METVS|nr:hypothetical protein [Methanococcus vannielii]ABR54030.1 hypothetical protein Mevan_0118 [Methanococcus vannielii SB]
MVDSVKYTVHIDYNKNLVSIHSTNCLDYVNSKKNGFNESLWLGPFETFEEACIISENHTEHLGCCKKCISIAVQDIICFKGLKLKNN